MKKKKSIKDTFKNWKEEGEPYYTRNVEGANVIAKKFKIYEDEKIKVSRIEEPTYVNEHENYIQVHIKYPFILFNMEIGGCITRDNAITNAKFILSKILK